MENQPNTKRFNIGDRVRVNEGVFAGFDGVVDKIVGDRVCILIEIAGCPKPLEIDPQRLDPA
jgi:transcription antitermination factor NusG